MKHTAMTPYSLVANAMDALGWDRNALASESGIHRTTLFRWEQAGEAPRYIVKWLSAELALRGQDRAKFDVPD